MLLKLIIIGTIPEMALLIPYFWKLRTWLSFLSVLMLTFASMVLIVWRINLFSVLILEVSLFRLINLCRVIEARINESYLFSVVKRSSGYLLFSQFLLAFFWYIYWRLDWHLKPLFLIETTAALQLIFAVTLLVVTKRNLSRITYTIPDQHYTDRDLPTVTVAIPARNETLDLSQCLESVIASDYPKIEVLVLDDCSQDKTSEVVKAFAQAGVRFIHGHEPKQNWLAKNQAYDQLADEASGEFILFCGVDTRLGPGTIRSLITTALFKKKSMISVLPKHFSQGPLSSLIQPMRYWWELAVPRRFFNRPAVLSTCWLISKQALSKLGGFDAVQSAVLPEAYFAKIMIESDGYSFIRNSGNLGVVSVKQFKDQFDRAIRLRYPEVHKRLELVLGLASTELLFLLGPQILLVWGIATHKILVLILAFISTICLLAIHGLILNASSKSYRLRQIINYPVMVVVELVLGLISMIRYEFSEVDWKGRNICLPVMHTAFNDGSSTPNLVQKSKRSIPY